MDKMDTPSLNLVPSSYLLVSDTSQRYVDACSVGSLCHLGGWDVTSVHAGDVCTRKLLYRQQMGSMNGGDTYWTTGHLHLHPVHRCTRPLLREQLTRLMVSAMLEVWAVGWTVTTLPRHASMNWLWCSSPLPRRRRRRARYASWGGAPPAP
jgi:hypothetical protein